MITGVEPLCHSAFQTWPSHSFCLRTQNPLILQQEAVIETFKRWSQVGIEVSSLAFSNVLHFTESFVRHQCPLPLVSFHCLRFAHNKQPQIGQPNLSAPRQHS